MCPIPILVLLQHHAMLCAFDERKPEFRECISALSKLYYGDIFVVKFRTFSNGFSFGSLIRCKFGILQKSSVDRINHLKSLVAFMSEATKELIWMNQREEPEVSRDWSCTDLDIEDLQAHGEV